MFAKAHRKKNGRSLADYFMKEKRDERVRLLELRGFASDNIRDAFQSIDAMALATKGEYPMLHVSVRNADGEHLSDEQWLHVADRMEAKLGLSGQMRGIVLHISEETGDAHMHIGWSRIDEESFTLKRVPFYILRLKEVCRELELELGLRILDNNPDRSIRIPTQDEYEQARRLGVNLNEVRETIRDCWEQSDNGQSLQAALEEQNLHLANGDRRDFVVVDEQGGVHALGQRILGVSAAEVRKRCSDLNRENLPAAEECRTSARTGMRDEHAANLAWEDALASAAIEKEKMVGRFAEPFSQDKLDKVAPAVLDELTRNRSTFGPRDVERALESDVENRPERTAMAAALLKRPEVVHLADPTGRADRYTTEKVLAGEREVAHSAAALRDQNWHGLAAGRVEPRLSDLSSERNRALASITGRSGFAVLDGQAGTGKSSVLAAAKDVYEANGYRVVGLAHTNLVAQDLRDKGFNRARTIDSELYALDHRRTDWNKRTVVMVDEAAMVDTRRLAAVLGHAQKTGAKVILAGDDRQLSSIERGGMFGVLKERHGAAVLSEVHRQHSSAERQASQSMAAGDFAKAIGIYADKNAIQWHGKQSEAAEALVDTYMRDRAADPAKTRFIFAYTNREVDQINAVVREARQSKGELGVSSVFDTKHGRAEVAVGDRLQFTETDKTRGICNGYSGTVREIRGTVVAVELDGRGKQAIEFDAAAFQGFRHGYAGTIYRGQGRTIDQTYLLHSEHWRSTSSYVALTRHSEKTQLFVARDTTENLPELARQMSRRDDRRAALAFSAVREEAANKRTAPDASAAWRINREDYTRDIRSAREEQRLRNERARRIHGDESVPHEVRVGQLGNAADLKVDGVRSAFAEIAQKRREREDEGASFSSGSYEAARRRWRIGRDGRQR